MTKIEKYAKKDKFGVCECQCLMIEYFNYSNNNNNNFKTNFVFVGH